MPGSIGKGWPVSLATSITAQDSQTTCCVAFQGVAGLCNAELYNVGFSQSATTAGPSQEKPLAILCQCFQHPVRAGML